MRGRDPAVASPTDSFYEDRILGGIPQSVAQAIDRTRNATVKIYEHAIRPERLTKLVAT
jgi:hypothetical protein